MGNSARTNIRTYRDSFQGIGCRTGCMLHLVFIGMLGVAVLVCQRFVQNQYTALFPAVWGTDLTCRDLEPALNEFWAGLKR